MSKNQAAPSPAAPAINPRSTRAEMHTSDIQIPQPEKVIIPGLGEALVREPEEVLVLDKPLETEELKALAFMEELLEIRLEPSSEENAPQLIDVYVNGQAEWVPVGRPWILKRKFVEVLARSKPMSVKTNHLTPEAAGNREITNEVIRTVRAKHPFSVLRDDNPKGREWLTRVLMDG